MFFFLRRANAASAMLIDLLTGITRKNRWGIEGGGSGRREERGGKEDSPRSSRENVGFVEGVEGDRKGGGGGHSLGVGRTNTDSAIPES